MKKLFCLVLILLVPVLVEARVRLIPYYRLDINEGYVTKKGGEGLFAHTLKNDIGFFWQFNKSHSLLLYYGLNYDGPGLKAQEFQKFTERGQDHTGFVKYSFKYKRTAINAKINYLKEFYRIATNEKWGEGLYDFNRLGGGVGVKQRLPEVAVLKKPEVKAALNFHQLKFPNYTDLLSEYLKGGESAEAMEGKQDQNLTAFSLKGKVQVAKILLINASYGFSHQGYLNQYVVQSDGTYGDKKQKNSTNKIEFGLTYYPIKNISLGIDYTLALKRSNQNYFFLKDPTDPTTGVFLSNYYAYNKHTAIPRIAFSYKNLMLGFSPRFITKKYIDHPIQDEDGNYLSKKMENEFKVYLVDLSIKIGKSLSLRPFYIYKISSSNTRYAKFISYDYRAHYFGTRLTFEY